MNDASVWYSIAILDIAQRIGVANEAVVLMADLISITEEWFDEGSKTGWRPWKR
jgi:hypothetical protein